MNLKRRAVLRVGANCPLNWQVMSKNGRFVLWMSCLGGELSLVLTQSLISYRRLTENIRIMMNKFCVEEEIDHRIKYITQQRCTAETKNKKQTLEKKRTDVKIRYDKPKQLLIKNKKESINENR